MVSAFSKFHPVLLLVYFAAVLGVLFSSFHPAAVVWALIGSIAYFYMLHGFRTAGRNVLYYFFVFFLLAAAYPSYVHNGFTPLFFLNDQAVTLEAVAKGLVTAGAIVAAAFWIKCYFEIFTTNNVLVVLTRISSNLAILVSMLWRFIPLFQTRWHEKRLAQQAAGYYRVDSKVEKLQRGFTVWKQTLIQTAEFVFMKPDVMKARGYGVKKKRTQYQIVNFTKYDLLLAAGLAGFLVYYLAFFPRFRIHFYPQLSDLTLSAVQHSLLGALMLLPFLYEVKESLKWRYLKSKI